jgi:hypothetical protein
MKKKQANQKLSLNKKSVSLLKENAKKALKGGGGKCSGQQDPLSPLCPPTVQENCDPPWTY